MGFYGFWMFLDPISVKSVDMGVNPKIKGRPRKWMVKIMVPNPIKNGCFGGLNTPIFGSTPIWKILCQETQPAFCAQTSALTREMLEISMARGSGVHKGRNKQAIYQ